MIDKPGISEDQHFTKEDYLIRRAKDALSTDLYAAKSWLITAKSLFPRSAKVQFEAYSLEKLSNNVREAAKCFSEIFQNFPQNREIWKEIEMITSSLRSEQGEETSNFLCQLFQHLPQELQKNLLIMTADQSDDTMEHCKLLLILLKKFPQTIPTHGPKLVETLLTAEKHSHPGKSVNDFRHLLICEALPILGSAPIELNARLCIRLINKAVEFYLGYIQQEIKYIQQDANRIQNPWDKLFQVIELLGKKLCWELSGLFLMPWNRDQYCDRLHQYANTHVSNLNDEPTIRQLLICVIVVFARILFEHNALIKNDEVSYCLVEAFIDPVPLEPRANKKRKRDELIGIVITSDSEYSGYGLSLAVKLYDLMHLNDSLKREALKLFQQMRIDGWLNSFITDLTMYKGMHHDLMQRLHQESNDPLCKHLRLASTCFYLRDYKNMIEHVSMVVNSLPTTQGKISNNLSVSSVRHLHYLTLARIPTLQFCCRLLLAAIIESSSVPGGIGDLAIGHALVLMQMDWPQESSTLALLSKKILSRRTFSYPLFQVYIICVDILEELTYLWSDHGGNVVLDIAVNSGILQNRRIGTRGADKGVKEEIKQIMRRQAARDGVDAIDELILRFILNEKGALQHCLMPNIIR